FFFQAEDGIRDRNVTGVQTCALPISLYFADRRMKTPDNYFRGFPAVWNIVAFYLFLLRLPPWIGAAIVALLAALTFVPVLFVHRSEERRVGKECRSRWVA